MHRFKYNLNNLGKVCSTQDLHETYLKRVPKMFVDYCDSGSWSQSTRDRDVVDWTKKLFRQRVLLDISNLTVKSKLLGVEHAMPVAIAPTGMAGMQHGNGEILAAQACEEFGIPYTLSTMSNCSIEDVAKNTTKPFWFQLYMMRDRAFMKQLIDRAKAAKCSALVLTADLQVIGERYADVKNGLSSPPKPTLGNIINLMGKPWWCANMALTPPHRWMFGNLTAGSKGVTDPRELAKWIGEQFDPKLSWKDIEWVKEQWGGPLIIKGIMEREDARGAVESGADALVVSNHGGRQLDGAPSTCTVLPEIVQEVDGKIEVFVDSGIRSGQDVLRAIAMGANGVLVGRPYLWALGSYGRAGVSKLLHILHDQLQTTMSFCGKTDINDVDSSILRDDKTHLNSD